MLEIKRFLSPARGRNDNETGLLQLPQLILNDKLNKTKAW
jgi:hypothetical protein